MSFDATRFAEEFKNTIDYMYEKGLKRDVEAMLEWKNGLRENEHYVPALKKLIELLVTQSWYFQKPRAFDERMEEFAAKHEAVFWTAAAQTDLAGLIDVVAPSKRVVGNGKRLIPLLAKYRSIRQFSDRLYELAQAGSTEVLGPKGRDNYLRDIGRWDRIPIDRHEIRFQLRTGIYHVCAPAGKSDPLDNAVYQAALRHFC